MVPNLRKPMAASRCSPSLWLPSRWSRSCSEMPVRRVGTNSGASVRSGGGNRRGPPQQQAVLQHAGPRSSRHRAPPRWTRSRGSVPLRRRLERQGLRHRRPRQHQLAVRRAGEERVDDARMHAERHAELGEAGAAALASQRLKRARACRALRLHRDARGDGPVNKSRSASPPNLRQSPPSCPATSRSSGNTVFNVSVSSSAPTLPRRASRSVRGVNPETSANTNVPRDLAPRGGALVFQPCGMQRRHVGQQRAVHLGDRRPLLGRDKLRPGPAHEKMPAEPLLAKYGGVVRNAAVNPPLNASISSSVKVTLQVARPSAVGGHASVRVGVEAGHGGAGPAAAAAVEELLVGEWVARGVGEPGLEHGKGADDPLGGHGGVGVHVPVPRVGCRVAGRVGGGHRERVRAQHGARAR